MENKQETQNNQEELLYGLDDKVPMGRSLVYGLQYLVYFVAASAILPVVVGTYLGLNQAEIATLLQRTFLMSGGISILQILLGHRFPIMDGPAGLWMGILIALAGSSVALGKDLAVLRTDIELGMLVAGAVVVVMALTGLINQILKIFTPIINGTFLILMSIQMGSTVVNGATGLSSGYTSIQMRYLIVFLVTLVVIIFVNLRATGFIQSIATIIGVACGWILAYALQIAEGPTNAGQGFFGIPTVFAWGRPTVDWSVIITCLIGEIVLFSNFVASINGMSDLLEKPAQKKDVRNGAMILGASAALSGVFCVVGAVPFASSPSMIRVTRVAARGPFIFGGIFAILMGLITPICMFFASMPAAVGYGAMIVTFAMMLEQGIREYKKIDFTIREGIIVGISIIVGAGIMFLDAEAFANLPQIVTYIASNGLVMGLLIAILMEHVFMRKSKKR